MGVLTFFIGLAVGGLIGVFTVCLMVTGRRN